MKRCKYERDEQGNSYWLPQCMGGAVYGPDGCTCDETRMVIEDALELLPRIVERLQDIEERLSIIEEK